MQFLIDTAAPYLTFADVPEALPGALALKRDMLFPSDCPHGIPALLPERLLSCPAGLATWPGDDLRQFAGPGPWLQIYGNSVQSLDMARTILAFYCDDTRFEKVWSWPDRFAAKVLNARMLGLIAPNFSLWRDSAEAVRIFNVYRSRWLSRYFQEAGIAVMPDVAWSGPQDYGFAFAGIPRGAPCVSVQFQTLNRHDQEAASIAAHGLFTLMCEVQPQAVLVYAGAPGRNLAEEVWSTKGYAAPLVLMPTLMEQRRYRLRALRKDSQDG